VLKQNYGSNATKVIEEVKAKLEEMKATFPPGVDYKISYDVSQFLDASIEQVLHTLRDAFILVALVVFVFLGDWRSTLIPILAVPVSLIGAFFVIQFFGLSINLVTLFALVLAIGIVVDDAIVVVEAVHAKMEEKPLPLSGRPRGDGRNQRGDHRHYHGHGIGFSADLLHGGSGRYLLPAVFHHHGECHHDFGRHRPHAHSGLVCHFAQKQPRQAPQVNPLTRLLDAFNRAFDKGTGRYTSGARRIVDRRAVTWSILIIFCAGYLRSEPILAGRLHPE
jgi:HAE1 family hydrophobic/amphiphilic exporter-1